MEAEEKMKPKQKRLRKYITYSSIVWYAVCNAITKEVLDKVWEMKEKITIDGIHKKMEIDTMRKKIRISKNEACIELHERRNLL